MSSDKATLKQDNPRGVVHDRYAALAREEYDEQTNVLAREERNELARALGYQDADIEASGEANLGLSCGNPLVFDRLASGDVVVDLGSGSGFDSLLAARAVGPEGRVIGIDMTHDMLELARRNARRSGLANVEFRQGFIEDIPLADASCDAVISNCVINLSTDKSKVFREVARILRPGGWLSVTDIVLNAPLPREMLNDMAAYAACLGGATQKREYLQHIEDAGFAAISVEHEFDVLSMIPEGMLAGMLARFGLAEGYLEDIPGSVIVSAHIRAERH